MAKGSFYEELIGSDWMGRTSDEYTYTKKGASIGWEETLTQGSAFSTFIMNVDSKQKHLTPEKQLFLAKQACSNIVGRMSAGLKKRTHITFAQDFQNYAKSDKTMICVSLEPLKPDNDIKFPTFNHALDPILGACAHEMGHILYTDAEYSDYIMKFKGVEQNLKASIMNILEDERIEKLIAENYRGYTHYVGKIKDYCFGKKFPKELEKTGYQESQEKVGRLYEVFLHLIRYPKALREHHVNEFENEIRQFQEILAQYPATIYELTQATELIYAVFFNFFKKEKQPQKQPQQQQQKQEQNQEEELEDQDEKPTESEEQEESESEQDSEGNESGEEENQEDFDGQGDGGEQIEQETEADSETGGGNVKSDKGEEVEEEDAEKTGGSEKGKQDEEADEEKESQDGSEAGEPETAEQGTEETQDGGESSGNGEESEEGADDADQGNNPFAGMTEEDLAEAMAEAVAEILQAIAEAEPELGTAEEIAEMLFGAKVDMGDTLQDISNFDNSDMSLRESSASKNTELAGLGIDQMSVVFLDPEKHSTTANHYDDSLAEVRTSASSLRAELQKMNRNTEITNTGLFEGTFDDGMLVDAIIGAKNVFSETFKIQNRGAVILLGIDESGSMQSSGNWRRAQQIAVLFERALDGVNNIDFFCYGHTTLYDETLSAKPTAINCYYEGRKKGNRRTLGKIYHHNTNRDGHAILEMVARTRERAPKDSPIIMFMISDGEPSESVPHGYSKKQYTKKCVDRVEQRLNTTVIHIAIESGIDSASMFNHYVKFTDHRTLVKDVSRLLKTIVVDRQTPITI